MGVEGSYLQQAHFMDKGLQNKLGGFFFFLPLKSHCIYKHDSLKQSSHFSQLMTFLRLLNISVLHLMLCPILGSICEPAHRHPSSTPWVFLDE